jgi:hypothetical protein
MPNFIIETRQKTDVLFPVPPPPAVVPPTAGLFVQTPPPDPSAVPSEVKPLAGNASRGFGSAAIDGYATIATLIISDQPFTATFFEAILSTGPFGLSQTFVAVASGGLFVVAQRFSPVGSFMKMTVANNSTSPEKVLSLLVQGVPCP